MKKNIWIINHYASEMYFNEGGRHYWFAKELKKKGYNPIIFCCNSKHDKLEEYCETKELFVEKSENSDSIPFVFVKSSLYTGNGLKRFKCMYNFYRNVKKACKKYAKKYCKPDIILASSVHPLSLVAGIKLAKKYKVRCISEIRDLWPEEIVSYSKKWKESDLLIKLLYLGEKWIYKKSDDIIFLQEGAYDYITKHRWNKTIPQSKVHYINNGVDIESFNLNSKINNYCDKDLDNKTLFKFVYTGSIRMVNNVGKLLDAAKKISIPNVVFLIWGDGDELEALKQRCKDEKINNVIFKGKVEKKYIPSIVSKSNVNILHWEMSEDLKYGPSYNKMFEYLASGRPVLSTLQTPYSIINRYMCGFSSLDNGVDGIADAINKMFNCAKDELDRMGNNSRLAAKEFDFTELTKSLIGIIER